MDKLLKLHENCIESVVIGISADLQTQAHMLMCGSLSKLEKKIRKSSGSKIKNGSVTDHLSEKRHSNPERLIHLEPRHLKD